MAMSKETVRKFETLMKYLPDATYTYRELWNAIAEADRLAKKDASIPESYATSLVPSDHLISKYFDQYFIEVGYYQDLNICSDDYWDDDYSYVPDENTLIEALYDRNSYDLSLKSYIRRKDTKINTEYISKRYTSDEIESMAHDIVHSFELGNEHVTTEYIQFLRDICDEK